MVREGDPRVVTKQERISVLVHTFNSEATLPALLNSVGWADEVIAIDMSSTDGTPEILEQHGAVTYRIPQSNWNDSLRNDWLSAPRFPWTLVLDADEYLAGDAEGVLRDLVASAPETVTAAALPRFNYCFGRVLTGKRWYPDPQIRLFRTDSVRYRARHHTPPAIRGKGILLEGPISDRPHIHHQHYATLADFAERQLRYALSDDYSEPLDFGRYQSLALGAVLDSRESPTPEERAMEIVLAHNHLLQALLHWEKNGRDEPLPIGFGWQFAPRIDTQIGQRESGDAQEKRPFGWVSPAIRKARRVFGRLLRSAP